MSLTFHMKGKTEVSVEYKDKIPKGMTAEEFKEKYGVVVWCDYFGCRHNVQVKDTQRTTGTLIKQRGYQPLGKDAGVWRGLCTRDEIGLKYTGGKPECFTSAVAKLVTQVLLVYFNQMALLMAGVLNRSTHLIIVLIYLINGIGEIKLHVKEL